MLQRVRANADRAVVVGREVHTLLRRAEDLDGAAAEVEALGEGAGVDVRAAQLEDRASVDHHGHALGHVHRRAV